MIKNKNKKQGLSVVEIIVAIAIFALIASALTSLSLGGYSGLLKGLEHSKASSLLDELMESTRAISSRAWNELIYSNTSTEIANNEWQFLGENLKNTNGIFERILSLDDVCRDENHNISDCPNGSVDIHTKKVLGTIKWDSGLNFENSIFAETYITNWDSRDWLQTNWNSGGGQAIWSNQNAFESSTNLDFSESGVLKLSLADFGAWINAGGTLVTQTSDNDFDSGTFTNTIRNGSGDNASVFLNQTTAWAMHINSGDGNDNLNDLFLASSTLGFAVGSSGKILKYDGTNWSEFVDVGNTELSSISAISASNIWAVGNSGKIYNYNGTNWSEFTDTGNETWNDLQMFSGTFGIAVGNSGALATFNGANWVESTIPSSQHIYAISGLSTSDIWAVGRSGRFWHYNGTIWSLNTDTGNENWNDVKMISTNEIWAVGNGGKIAFYDGVSWDENIISPTTENLYSLYTISSNNIFAVGDKGKILHYDGNLWSEFADTGNENWRSIFMLNANSGFVVGDGYSIFEYGGAYAPSGTFISSVINSGSPTTIWNSIYWTEILPIGGDITISTRSGNTAIPDGTWSVWGAELSLETLSAIDAPSGQYLQYRVTLSRGTNPNESPEFAEITIIYNSPTSETLHDLDFINENEIWAVGNNGEIIKYNGSNWIQITSPVVDHILDIDMLSSSLGFAVGDKGKVLNYDGLDWVEQIDTGSDVWNAVSMASSTFGYAVGDKNGSDGNLLFYNGGGWSSVLVTGLNENLNDVFVLDDTLAFAVGDNGKILKFNGFTWIEDVDLGISNILGINMVSANFGFAVGGAGKIYSYNGSIWSEHTDTGDQNWRAVYCYNTSYCFVIGEGGEIYKWDGNAWQSVSSPTNQNLNGIIILDQTKAWAVGENATIISFSQNALYESSGSLISSAFDLGDPSPIQTIRWNEIIPTCSPVCDIEFEISVALDNGGSPGVWSDWYGVSGVGSVFTNPNGSLVPLNLNGFEWVRYRVSLIGDNNNTPILEEIKINYK